MNPMKWSARRRLCRRARIPVVVGDASSSSISLRVAATPAVASVAPAVVSLMEASLQYKEARSLPT